MDRVHKWNDYAQHERRMKQPERGSDGHNQHEYPGGQTRLQAMSPAKPRALQSHAQALQHEVSGAQSISAPSGYRNDQIVNEPRSHKNQQPGRGDAGALVKWTEDQIVSQLSKS